MTPDYLLTIDGRDITPGLKSRLMRLQLAESRGDEADQLDVTLDDADGRLALPPSGARIDLRIGWAGQPLVDKGSFVVDEVEHGGAPDQVSIRARSADLHRSLRQRSEASYHDTTLGELVRSIAARNGLQATVDDALASVPVPHVDQTHESDLNFLTRLARQHDAVCTVKKGQLIFRAINGARLAAVHITRALGDSHRWHRAERTSYSGVRASWQDPRTAQKRDVLVGEDGDEKRLKDTYGSEGDALAAARAEQGRIERGKATLELTLALGRPELMPQTPATVTGFKPEIDAATWLVVKVTHSIDDGQGFTTRVELERAGAAA